MANTHYITETNLANIVSLKYLIKYVENYLFMFINLLKDFF